MARLRWNTEETDTTDTTEHRFYFFGKQNRHFGGTGGVGLLGVPSE